MTDRMDLKTIDIPVIGPDTDRDELMRYIRILEERLEISYVYVYDPSVPRDRKFLQFRREDLSQEERVRMLKSGCDAVGLRELREAVLANPQALLDLGEEGSDALSDPSSRLKD